MNFHLLHLGGGSNYSSASHYSSTVLLQALIVFVSQIYREIFKKIQKIIFRSVLMVITPTVYILKLPKSMELHASDQLICLNFIISISFLLTWRLFKPLALFRRNTVYDYEILSLNLKYFPPYLYPFQSNSPLY